MDYKDKAKEVLANLKTALASLDVSKRRKLKRCQILYTSVIELLDGDRDATLKEYLIKSSDKYINKLRRFVEASEGSNGSSLLVDAHPKPKLFRTTPAYNVLSSNHNVSKSVLRKSFDEEQTRQTYSAYLFEQLTALPDIPSVIDLIHKCRPSDTNTAAGVTSFDLRKLCCISITRNEPERLQRVMLSAQSLLSTGITDDVLNDSKRLKSLQEDLHCFLTFCNMKHDYIRNLQQSPLYEDCLAALLSIYVDITLASSRLLPSAERNDIGRRLLVFISYLLREHLDHRLDVLIQLTQVRSTDNDLLEPFNVKVLSVSPAPDAGPKIYSKYVIAVRNLNNILSHSMTDVIKTAGQVPAPRGYVEWLSQQDGDITDKLPVTKKFKKTRVTSYLLTEASDDVIDDILDMLTDDHSVDTVTKESNEMEIEPTTDSGECTFFVDTRGDRPNGETNAVPEKDLEALVFEEAGDDLLSPTEFSSSQEMMEVEHIHEISVDCEDMQEKSGRKKRRKIVESPMKAKDTLPIIEDALETSLVLKSVESGDKDDIGDRSASKKRRKIAAESPLKAKDTLPIMEDALETSFVLKCVDNGNNDEVGDKSSTKKRRKIAVESTANEPLPVMIDALETSYVLKSADNDLLSPTQTKVSLSNGNVEGSQQKTVVENGANDTVEKSSSKKRRKEVEKTRATNNETSVESVEPVKSDSGETIVYDQTLSDKMQEEVEDVSEKPKKEKRVKEKTSPQKRQKIGKNDINTETDSILFDTSIRNASEPRAESDEDLFVDAADSTIACNATSFFETPSSQIFIMPERNDDFEVKSPPERKSLSAELAKYETPQNMKTREYSSVDSSSPRPSPKKLKKVDSFPSPSSSVKFEKVTRPSPQSTPSKILSNVTPRSPQSIADVKLKSCEVVITESSPSLPFSPNSKSTVRNDLKTVTSSASKCVASSSERVVENVSPVQVSRIQTRLCDADNVKTGPMSFIELVATATVSSDDSSSQSYDDVVAEYLDARKKNKKDDGEDSNSSILVTRGKRSRSMTPKSRVSASGGGVSARTAMRLRSKDPHAVTTTTDESNEPSTQVETTRETSVRSPKSTRSSSSEPNAKMEKRNWEQFSSPKPDDESALPDIDKLLKDIRYGRNENSGMSPPKIVTTLTSCGHELDPPASQGSNSKSPKKGSSDRSEITSTIHNSPQPSTSGSYRSPRSASSKKINSKRSSVGGSKRRISGEDEQFGSQESNGVTTRSRSARLLMQHASPVATSKDVSGGGAEVRSSARKERKLSSGSETQSSAKKGRRLSEEFTAIKSSPEKKL